MFLKNVNIGWRLGLGFTSIIFLMIILSGVTIGYMKQLADMTTKLYRHPFAVSTAVHRIEDNIARMQQSLRDLASTASFEDMDNATAKINDMEDEVFRDFKIVQERFLGDKKKVETARQIFAQWKGIRTEVIELMRSGHTQDAVLTIKGRGEQHLDILASAMFEFIEFAQGKADSFLANAENTRDHILLFTYILVGLIILAGTALGIMLTRSITRPLGAAIKGAGELGKGNLLKRIEIESTDEIGSLVSSFNHMAESLYRKTVSKDYLDNILSSMTETLIVVSPEKKGNPGNWAKAKINTVNHSACFMLGYTEEELLQQPVSSIFFEEEWEKNDWHEKLIEKGFMWGLEKTFRHKSGTPIPVLFSGSVLLGPGGDIEGIIYVAQDFTKRKEVEKALAEKTGELVRSNKELEQFAYVASHDLQEPLRMVVSYMELLERRYKGKLDSDADDFIHYAADGARRMQTLINDLLEYSRVGTKGNPLELTDSEGALRDALFNLQGAIKKHGAKVTHDPLPKVLTDPAQLMRIFQNLIGNAIKFQDESPPEIHVSAERLDNSALRTPHSELDKGWIFSVRDNGLGIAPEFQERIFIIFQRLHGQEKYAGTGIGLAICKKIVERHGGRMWVKSEPGTGSTFYFTIPEVPNLECSVRNAKMGDGRN